MNLLVPIAHSLRTVYLCPYMESIMIKFYELNSLCEKFNVSMHVLVWNLDIVKEVCGTECNPDALTSYEYFAVVDLLLE